MHTSIRSTIRIAALVAACAALTISAAAQTPASVTSPDGRNRVTVEIRNGGLYYSLQRDNRPVIKPSQLGFLFKGAPPLKDGLQLVSAAPGPSVDETWTQPWGEVARVRDHHNELRVSVAETGSLARRFDVVFRLFNDGLGFRYEVPAQPNLGQFEMMDELTEFYMANNARAWWIPSNSPHNDRQEQLYGSSPLTRVDSALTPFTMEMQNGLHVVIHEANLKDYASMGLKGFEDAKLKAALAPYADGVKVRGTTPFVTPWRTVQLADRAADLAPSVLGLNLNPPNVLPSTSWIKPMKYVGIWWGMHVGRLPETDSSRYYTWSSGPRHGATTVHTKQYIDFAAANGFGGVLVEGWNLGWDGNWYGNADIFNFTQAYPDYDIKWLASYAQSKGVTLIGHNETSMGIPNYERQMVAAYKLYHSLGIKAIKTGYVGDNTPQGHSHFGQYAVQHHRRVIEEAARNEIMVDVHEPIKDTGERRTYPNMMAREGARGQEFNAWSGDGGNPPEHETILFFTRMLSGPMDFTPGIFDILIQRATGRPRTNEEPRVRTTLAKQLALYVVLYSPLEMAADLPENYVGRPEFQFIRDVPVDWEESHVLEGKIGDYVIVARRQRGGDTWAVGGITDEEGRTFNVPLSFLTKGRQYVAEIYADGKDASWLTNPLPVAISKQNVNSATRLNMVFAPGGGQAILIRPVR